MRAGNAIVRLASTAYEGHVELHERALTVDGRVRSMAWFDGDNRVRYGLSVSKTIPLHRVLEVDWLEVAA
jgi:hypothetical protein